jgi:PRTRC genetic system protein C
MAVVEWQGSEDANHATASFSQYVQDRYEVGDAPHCVTCGSLMVRNGSCHKRKLWQYEWLLLIAKAGQLTASTLNDLGIASTWSMCAVDSLSLLPNGRQSVPNQYLGEIKMATSTLKTSTLPREFVFNGSRIPDPDPQMSIDQVRDLLTPSYPELATATMTGPEDTGTSLRYSFSRAIGSKG